MNDETGDLGIDRATALFMFLFGTPPGWLILFVTTFVIVLIVRAIRRRP